MAPTLDPKLDLNSLLAQLGSQQSSGIPSSIPPMVGPAGVPLNFGPPALGPGPAPTIPTPPRFAGTATGIVDDLAAQLGDDVGRNLPALWQGANAAGSGGGAGLLGKLGSLGGGFKNPLAAGGGIKGLAKASLPGLGLSIGGNFIGNEIGGGVGDFISGAATGAGLGLMFGAPGALIGGAAGGLLSLFGDDDEEKPEDKLISFIQRANLSDEKKASYLLQYEILRETSGNEKAALQTVGQQIVTDMANAEQAQEQQQKMLASQALTAQFFQPFTQQLLDSAQQRARIGEQLAGQLPEGYRQIAQMQNAASLDNATRTANAYAAQAQILPAFDAMQQQQQLANQLAQQQAAQVMQQVAGAGAAGGGGLASLIQQLGG